MMMGLILKLHPLFVLSIVFLLLSPTYISPSHAEGSDTVSEWKEERNDEASKGNKSKTTFKLAANRTRRIDPSGYFKYYEGGWDFTSTHYLVSLLYSGAPLVYTAVGWFFAGIILFLIALCSFCCCCFCNNNSRKGYSRTLYLLCFSLVSLFFVITLVGGVTVYTGEGNFRKASKEVMNVIVKKVMTVVDLLNDVLKNLDGALNLAIGSYVLPEEFKQNIQNIRSIFDKTTSISKVQPKKVFKEISNFLDLVQGWRGFFSYGEDSTFFRPKLFEWRASEITWLRILTAIMLVLALLGFVFSVCGCKLIVYVLFFIGWILVTVTLLLSSASLIVQNGVGDTCVAMEDWLHHPNSDTILSNLLPCVDGATSQQALDVTKRTSFETVKMVNDFFKNVVNVDEPPKESEDPTQIIFFNQSGPSLPFLCNPFYPNFTSRQCDPHEVHLLDTPQVYKGFVCTTKDGMCNSEGRLTPELYREVTIAANISNILQRDGPRMVDLADCTFVAETFDEITKNHCPPMRLYANHIFIGLMLLSLALMLSLTLWVDFATERQKRKYSKFYTKAHAGF